MFALPQTLWRHRELIRQLVRQDVVGRYRGSVLGVFWSFAHPLFMLAVYTIVFGQFFQAKWGGAGSTWEFALVLFSGLIIFNVFADCVTRAPTLITNNPNFVKKVIFPLEILPIVAAGSALFHASVSFLAWLCFYVVLKGIPPVTMFYLPLILLVFLPILLGFGWLLAAAAVFLKDVNQAIGLFTQALLFMSPVFYAIEIVPESVRPFMQLNPLTIIIEQSRTVMLAGSPPDFGLLAIYFAVSLCVAWVGLAFFQRLRSVFADVV